MSSKVDDDGVILLTVGEVSVTFKNEMLLRVANHKGFFHIHIVFYMYDISFFCCGF